MASEGLSRGTWLTAGVWVIATVAIGFLLNQGAKILAPFAMAIFVWLVMEGFSRAITKNFPKVPGWLTYVIAVTIVAMLKTRLSPIWLVALGAVVGALGGI